jgi:hypothetical protein
MSFGLPSGYDLTSCRTAGYAERDTHNKEDMMATLKKDTTVRMSLETAPNFGERYLVLKNLSKDRARLRHSALVTKSWCRRPSTTPPRAS